MNIGQKPRRKLSEYEKIFINMAKAYIKTYTNNAFKFYFDDISYPKIGNSERVIHVKFHKSRHVFKRIFTEGSLGLGESYCNGLIEIDDRDYKYLLFIFVRAVSDKSFVKKLPLKDILRILKIKFSSKFFKCENQSENINSHYSLTDWFDSLDDSNKFYLYWLDNLTYQYSCAKWDKNTKGLVEAELNKFDFYTKRLGITKKDKGKKILDLGCGWGGYTYYIAEKYGLNVTCMTLSKAQARFIEQQVKKRKLQKKVTVINDNVHNMKGEYDYVISIGLLEHIDDYDRLYKKTRKVLKKGGSALFHSMFHRSYFYRSDPFLLKYIFPGGGTPNIYKNVRIFKKYFKSVSRNDLPDLSYPKTLDVWYNSFLKNEPKMRRLLEKSKCEDPEFAIRVFKHYLMLASVALTVNGLVSNIRVR